MKVLTTIYASANEVGEQQITVVFELSWFDQLLGRPRYKEFVRGVDRLAGPLPSTQAGGWVEKRTRSQLTLNEALLVSDTLFGTMQ